MKNAGAVIDCTQETFKAMMKRTMLNNLAPRSPPCNAIHYYGQPEPPSSQHTGWTECLSKRLRQLHCHKDRLRRSFLPKAIILYNRFCPLRQIAFWTQWQIMYIWFINPHCTFFTVHLHICLFCCTYINLSVQLPTVKYFQLPYSFCNYCIGCFVFCFLFFAVFFLSAAKLQFPNLGPTKFYLI